MFDLKSQTVAVLGELDRQHRMFAKGVSDERQFQNLTVYFLSRTLHISRYHIDIGLEECREKGYVSYQYREGRNKVSRPCYWITSEGQKVVDHYVATGRYKDILQWQYREAEKQLRRRIHGTDYRKFFSVGE